MKKVWGFFIFCAFSLLSLARLLVQKFPGHYEVFTRAARALWHNQMAYGTDLGTGVGYFFYSPSCALFFFGPFTLLPQKLGLALYMVFSWVIFVTGAIAISKSFSKISRFQKWKNIFWIGITPQIVGGILASKLEIIMTGLIFWTAGIILDKDKHKWIAAMILAMITNWKFQPFPTAALIFLSLVFIQKEWKLPFYYFSFLALFYVLPFAFKPYPYLIEQHRLWTTTLADFSKEAWPDFENIYAFGLHGFGIPITFEIVQWLGIVCGLTLAIVQILWIFQLKGTKKNKAVSGSILLALALGSMFITVFSPLGQNNALILYAPLLWVGILSYAIINESHWKKAALVLIVFSWIIMTFSYSDVVPHDLQLKLRYLTVKPLACALLGVTVIVTWFKEVRTITSF